MSDVPFVARDEIVEADDLVPFGEEAVGQMAPEESRGSGDDDTHETTIVRGPRQGTAFLVLPPSGASLLARATRAAGSSGPREPRAARPARPRCSPRSGRFR